jgi:hypothetical protein
MSLLRFVAAGALLFPIVGCGSTSDNGSPAPTDDAGDANVAEASSDASTAADVASDVSRVEASAEAEVEAARSEAGASDVGTRDVGVSDGANPSDVVDGAARDAAGDALVEAAVDPFACLGAPLPTTAPATLQIGGLVAGVDTTPIDAVAVEAFIGTSTAASATATSAANGTFTVTLATSGTPLDGFLRATKTGFIDSFFYPPTPVAANTSQAAILLATTQTFAALTALAQVTPDPTAGTLVVDVLDCLGHPVSGAAITVLPAGTIRYLQNMTPSTTATSTDATGLAAAFNVSAGAVMVGASVGGRTLRQHMLNVRADVVTITSVVP